MKSIRRLMRFLLTVFVTHAVVLAVVLGVLFFASDLWAPPIKDWLVRQARRTAAVELEIANLRFVSIWPITMRLEGVTAHMPQAGIKGSVAAINLATHLSRVDQNWLRPKVHVALVLARPDFAVVSAPAAAKQEPQVSTGAVSLAPTIRRPQGVDVELAVAVQDGRCMVLSGSQTITFEQFHLVGSLPSARAEIWRPELKVMSLVSTELLGMKHEQKITLNLSDNELGADGLTVKAGEMDLFGFKFLLKGRHSFSSPDRDWTAELTGGDLAEVPPAFFPEGQWRGRLTGSFRYRVAGEAPALVTGQLSGAAIEGDVALKRDGLTVDGLVKLGLNLRFRLERELVVDDATVTVDLTGAKVALEPWFDKAKGMELIFNLVGDGGSQKFSLRRGQVRLAHIKVNADGEMGMTPGWPVAVRVRAPETPLTGLEKIVLPLASAPVKGMVVADIEIKGPSQRFNELVTNIRTLHLRQGEGVLKYKSPDGTIAGVMRGEVGVSGGLLGSKPRELSVNGNLDLTGVKVDWGQVIKKSPAWPLSVIFAGRWQEPALHIDQLRITGAGNFAAQGKLVMKQPLGVGMAVSWRDLDLEPWLEITGQKQLGLSGSSNGMLRFSGKWIRDEGLMGSPLQASGEVSLRKGRWIMTPRAESNQEPSPSVAPSGPAPAILPSWPILRTAKVKTDLEMVRMQLGSLDLGSVTARGEFAAAQWRGGITIGEVFSGQIRADKVIVSPGVSPPAIELSGQWQNLAVAAMLGWVKPDLKRLMEGKLSGKVSLMGALPLAGMGFEQMKVDGKIELNQAEFKSFMLSEKINGALGRAGLGGGVKVGDMRFRATTGFSFQDQVLALSDLILTTDQRDELKLRGQVRSTLELDLTGSAALASVKAGGAIAEANRDASGRLVVPLQIRGSALDPDFGIALATIKKMIGNTLDREAEKATDRLKQQVGDDLKKKFKNILGR